MLHDPIDDSYDPSRHSASSRDVGAAWVVASAVAGLGWLLLGLM